MQVDDAGRQPILSGELGYVSLHTGADPALANEFDVGVDYAERIPMRWGMAAALDTALMEGSPAFQFLSGGGGMQAESVAVWSAPAGGDRWASEALPAPVQPQLGMAIMIDRAVHTLPMLPEYPNVPANAGIGIVQGWVAFKTDTWAAFGSEDMQRKLGLLGGYFTFFDGNPAAGGIEVDGAGYERTLLDDPMRLHPVETTLYQTRSVIETVHVQVTFPRTSWSYTYEAIMSEQHGGVLLAYNATGRTVISTRAFVRIPAGDGIFGWQPGRVYQSGGFLIADGFRANPLPAGTLGGPGFVTFDDRTARVIPEPVEMRLRAGTGPIIVQVYEPGQSPTRPAVTLYTVGAWELVPGVQLTKIAGPRGTPVQALAHVREQVINITPHGETRAFLEAGRVHGDVEEIAGSDVPVLRLMNAFAVGAGLKDQAGLEAVLGALALTPGHASGLYEIRLELTDAAAPAATAQLWRLTGSAPVRLGDAALFAAALDGGDFYTAGAGVVGDTAVVVLTADAPVVEGVEITWEGNPRARLFRVLAMSGRETGNEWAVLTADSCAVDEAAYSAERGAVPEIPYKLTVLGADARLRQCAILAALPVGGYQTPIN